MLRGLLTLFLYCHKLLLLCFLNRSLVDISISPYDDVMHNHVSLGTKATVVWHIGPFELPRFSQVISST